MTMSLNRRAAQKVSASIWPGFVDAMTALLLVMMFVLTIFMVVQFVLREEISGQADELSALGREIAGLNELLGIERLRSSRLANTNTALRSDLDGVQTQLSQQTALVASLNARFETQAAQIASFEEQVATLLAERDLALRENSELVANVEDLEQARAQLISDQEALELALARARDEVDEQEQAARLAAARREALDALIAEQRAELAVRDASLAQALAALDAAKADSGDLSGRMEALQTELDAQEAARLREAAAAEALRQRLTQLELNLNAEEAARLADAAAAEALRQRLQDADAELTAMSLALEKQRREAENTLTLLAAAETVNTELDEKLVLALLATDQSEQEIARLNDRLVEAMTQIDSQAAENAARLGELERSEALLAAALSTQDAQDLELARISQALAAAEIAREVFQGDLTDARTLLAEAEAELAQLRETAGRDATERDRLAAQLAQARADSDALRASVEDRLSLRDQLGAALAAKLAAERQLSEQMSESERTAVLLATAQTQLAKQESVSADQQRDMAALRLEARNLRASLGELQSLLDLADEAEAAANVRIETLSSQLNSALARAAAEANRRAELEAAERARLERYESEFFGRLRDVFDGIDEVEIVGDRFVFRSEVLFDSGEVDLANEGAQQIARVASLLKDVSDEIPPEIDWVIRIDGHTDNIPVQAGAQYQDNWDLSQARALAVARYMIDELGFDPKRLAPTGFGEFRPVDLGNTAASRRLNRRIEFKLTER